MFGGYYLGQLYLGISGLPSSGVLSVVPSSHQLSSDNINLTQKHTIVVSYDSYTLTSDNITLTQKHTLSVSNASHSLLIDALGGLINIQPYGMGGGFGAVDGWGVAEFGSINIELPLNFLILADDALHNLSSDELDAFIQIFNMVRTGEYIKDFGEAGQVGSEYTKDTGTMPVKNGSFGQITPVPESNHGFFIVEIGTSGSYTQNGKTNGILTSGNSSSGIYLTDEEDTGNYIKIK